MTIASTDRTHRGRSLKLLPVALLALGTLAGCGDSARRLNPFTWFGGGSSSRVVTTTETAPAAPIDGRALVPQVSALSVDQSAGGSVITAVGIPPRIGYWNGELVPANPELLPDQNGVLSFDFRISPPLEAFPTGTPRTRSVEVGFFISRQDLARVKVIEVRGQQNVRSIRR